MERAALLLALFQTVGVYAMELLERVGPYGFGIGDICPDLLVRYCELPFHQKVGVRCPDDWTVNDRARRAPQTTA